MTVPLSRGLTQKYAINDGAGVIIHSYPEYTMLVDYNVSNQAIYIGRALPGSSQSGFSWQIKSVTYDVNGNATAPAQWANGSDAPVNQWTQRASYTYS